MRAKIKDAKRVVVKLGSNLFFNGEGGLALDRVSALIDDLARARLDGKQVLVVSSGAVALGASALHRQSALLVQKQAFAAVGQSRLMNVYEQGFSKHGLIAAQVLLTSQDFTNANRFANLRNTLMTLLEIEAVIPVINENDTVATEELEETDRDHSFSDNDQLSARVMSRLEADLLILLSDVDGLYTGNPTENSEAEFIPEVHQITAEIESLAGTKSARGRGGMATKIQAAGIAMDSGGMAIIANGTKTGVLKRIFDGETEGTLFLAKK
jgi:glutamate 5-kinase